MPTKREMAREIRLLKKRLRENEELLRAAAMKVESVQGVYFETDAIREQSKRREEEKAKSVVK